MPTTDASPLRSQVIDSVLSTAAILLQMEVVFIAHCDEHDYTFERVRGDMPGVIEGKTVDRSITMCHRMLDGATATTCDAANDADYAEAPIRAELGICSYVGVPIRTPDGTLYGTLCGIDRGTVAVSDNAVAVLGEIATVIAHHLASSGSRPGDEGVVIRRTPTGWRVGDEDSEDLVSAMALADLLADDMPPVGRPARAGDDADELTRLRVSVGQLEHALAARVVVEQAIGILAERHQIAPRAAFERLRKVARARGLKVHKLARAVVDSATETVTLPTELAAKH